MKTSSWFPFFHLWIELPFFSVRSQVMRVRYECEILDYVSFDVRLFKWRFEFSLYDTFKRIQERKRIKEQK
jgi:hypothetical protein